AVKHSGAKSKAKLGWIAAAGVGGGALLIMLLAFVIADGSNPDPKEFQAKMPPPPNLAGKSFEEVQRIQEEYMRQVQEESDKIQEKAASAIKAPFRWVGVGELLCLLLHIGTVAMPALAALSIYSSTGGGGGGGGRSKKRSRRDDDDHDDDD
ncbi:MAG: hypothetical protein U0791_10980, partial [Gemmataceae bacterium]